MAAEALEQSMLESKDKEQLLAIAQALGIKTTARAAKATLIDKILETTGGGSSTAPTPPASNGRAAKASKDTAPAVIVDAGVTEADEAGETTEATVVPESAADEQSAAQRSDAPEVDAEVVLGPDGEPLADWEIALIKSGEVQVTELAVSPAASAPSHSSAPTGADGDEGDGEGDAESRNSRRRRRRRNKGRADGPQGGDQERFDRPDRPDDAAPPISMEPVQVSGYLDLRDEGYGFLRVTGYLASRDDAVHPGETDPAVRPAQRRLRHRAEPSGGP